MKSSVLRPPFSSVHGLWPAVYGPLQPSVVRPASSPLRRPSSVVRRLSSGFTLVELLVVIVVIAILMSITLPLSKYAMRRANEARQEVMLAKICSALDDYRTTYGEYPITPETNNVPPKNLPDVLRHFPANYATLDAFQTNSSSTNVCFSGGSTIETISDIHSEEYPVDYCLTYPLMYKQLDKGARPFMEFTIVDVIYLVTREVAGTDTKSFDAFIRTISGKILPVTLTGIYGDAVKRAMAIDPVSGKQWKYVCTDGMSYILTTNSF